MPSTGNPFAGFQLPNFEGVGEDPKAKSKADKKLAELQGKLQKQLAQMNYENQLKLQQGQQQFQKPFSEAELLGVYNGQTTLAGKQQQQNKYEFDVTSRQQEEMNVLKRDMSYREMALAELTQQQNNAIQRGELDLAREMQTRKVALEEELGRGQLALDKMQTSGYMDNGQLTEDARQNRVEEALRQAEISGVFTDPDTGEVKGVTEARRQHEAEMALKNTQTMGVDENGNLTDAGQQWRSQMGLDYARTAAQLAQSPADYFESAAYMRGAQGSGATSFLDTINQTGFGSNMGFRSAQQGLPQVNSMQNIAQGGQPAPQAGQTPTGQPMPQYPDRPIGTEGVQGTPQGPLDPYLQQWMMKQAEGGGVEGATRAGEGLTPEQVQMMKTQQMVGTGAEGGAWTTERVVQPINTVMDEKLRMLQAQGGAGQIQNAIRDSGPSPSISAAQGAAAGQPTGYTETMNRPVPAPQAQGNGVYGSVAQQRLQAFAPVFQAGAHKLAPGALESMSASEKGLFSSAAKASGINPQDFEESYKRSRLQTGVGASAV
jgi:hypothetical protein